MKIKEDNVVGGVANLDTMSKVSASCSEHSTCEILDEQSRSQILAPLTMLCDTQTAQPQTAMECSGKASLRGATFGLKSE